MSVRSSHFLCDATWALAGWRRSGISKRTEIAEVWVSLWEMSYSYQAVWWVPPGNQHCKSMEKANGSAVRLSAGGSGCSGPGRERMVLAKTVPKMSLNSSWTTQGVNMGWWIGMEKGRPKERGRAFSFIDVTPELEQCLVQNNKYLQQTPSKYLL